MNPPDLHRFDGASVLVRSARDQRNPPIALRGTLDTKTAPGSVKVLLEFPEMFLSSAQREILTLTPPQVDRLLASEHDGNFEVTIDDPLRALPNPFVPHVRS